MCSSRHANCHALLQTCFDLLVVPLPAGVPIDRHVLAPEVAGRLEPQDLGNLVGVGVEQLLDT